MIRKHNLNKQKINYMKHQINYKIMKNKYKIQLILKKICNKKLHNQKLMDNNVLIKFLNLMNN